MASQKFDGIVETVRYLPSGQIEILRVFERRGAVFSDRLLLSRQALIERLKAGKVFMTGKRLPQLAGTFEVRDRLRLEHPQTDGGIAPEKTIGDDFPKKIIGDVVVASGSKTLSDHDHLDGTPIF